MTENEFYAEYTHPTQLGEDAHSAVINVQVDANGSAVVLLDDLTPLLRAAGFILTRAAWLNDGNTVGLCDRCGHSVTDHRVTLESDWCEGHSMCPCDEGFVPGGSTDTLGTDFPAEQREAWREVNRILDEYGDGPEYREAWAAWEVLARANSLGSTGDEPRGTGS